MPHISPKPLSEHLSSCLDEKRLLWFYRLFNGHLYVTKPSRRETTHLSVFHAMSCFFSFSFLFVVENTSLCSLGSTDVRKGWGGVGGYFTANSLKVL